MKIQLYLILCVAVLSFSSIARAEEGSSEVSDSEMTLDYYTELAQQGSAYAQLALGEMYSEGQGVEKNLLQAYAWFYVAAMQGVTEAKVELKKVFEKIDKKQQAEAEILASNYLAKYVP